MTKPRFKINPQEYTIKAVRASGPGGQHVNKVSTAVQLHFDIQASSLSDQQKAQVLNYNDQRITPDGHINIKVQDFRSQKKNKELAAQRLNVLIEKACKRPKKRIQTKPTKASQSRRLDNKSHHSKIKTGRKKVNIPNE